MLALHLHSMPLQPGEVVHTQSALKACYVDASHVQGVGASLPGKQQ